MEKNDIAVLVTLINALWGPPLAVLALNYPLTEKVIIMLIVLASIVIPLSISIRGRHKKLPLFPFIPLRYYAAFIVMITVLTIGEALVLLYVGIYYIMLILPLVLLLPISLTSMILVSALFVCSIAIGIIMLVIAFLRVRTWRSSPKLDLSKELKG